LSELKQKFDDEMETYRSYSYFFAKSVKQPPTYEDMKAQTGYSMAINVDRYGLRLIEFTWQDEIVRSSFNLPATSVYGTSEEFAKFMWGSMSKPMNNAEFKMSYPEVISNVTVVRHCAIVYDDAKLDKAGLAIVTTIVDSEYLQNLVGDNPYLIVFTESPEGGFVFSDPNINSEHDLESIRSADVTNKPFAILIINNQKYYMAKIPLYVMQGKVISDIGILYGFETVNKIVTMFQRISIIVFILSVGIAVLIAFIFARRITVPILTLKNMAHEFETNFEPIPAPDAMKDEIDGLQKSFSEMSSSIISKTSELQKANEAISALVEQQNGDYFLTSLLIQPLVPNSVDSDIINVQFYINQKKKFTFRHWEAQLGGDICIARMIRLRNKQHIVFANGDAMGKTMQGAGGARVMGVRRPEQPHRPYSVLPFGAEQVASRLARGGLKPARTHLRILRREHDDVRHHRPHRRRHRPRAVFQRGTSVDGALPRRKGILRRGRIQSRKEARHGRFCASLHQGYTAQAGRHPVHGV
jgi:HAMP domain-containing protein